MRVLILEHICGGPLANEPLPPALARAGGAMLGAAVEDFRAAGCDVVTTLDARVNLPIEGAHVFHIERGAPWMEIVAREAKSADAALVIAPETNGLLAAWCDRLHAWNVRSLGPNASAVRLCADKHALAQHLLARHVPTPPTRVVTPATLLESLALAMQLEQGAVVVKPVDGAGCEDTFVCRDRRDVDRLRETLAHHAADARRLVQPYITGLAASASFIVHGSTVRPLPAGEQFVRGDFQLSYEGGCLPLDGNAMHNGNATVDGTAARDRNARAAALAEQAIRAVPGLHGFVGVDLVLADDPRDDVVIEINPRLTVSYCGLRQLCTTQLAAAMLDPAAPLEWRSRRVRFDHAGRVAWETEA